MLAETPVEEVERALTEALARHGVPGRVVVRERVAEFHGGGPVVAVDVGELVDQWTLLPEDLRAGKVASAVDRLRAAVAAALPPPESGTDVAPLVGKLVGGLVLLATLGGAAYWVSRPRPQTPGAASSVAATATPAEKASAEASATELRARESCEATRRRLYAGATAFEVDPAGWVIELWLARDADARPLAEEPAIRQANHEALAPTIGAEAPASVSAVATGEPGRVRLRFDGGYLHAFMKAEGRDRFVRLVDQLAGATRAEHAALFARCAHLTVRDIGAYFRGVDAAGAAASLLFAQGLFADPPIVDRTRLGNELSALISVKKTTAGLALEQLSELVRDSGAQVSSSPPEATPPHVAIGFALGGPTRAQQAARALAKARKLQ